MFLCFALLSTGLSLINASLFQSLRVKRKSVLQPAIRASCSYHVLAHKSFQLAQKPFLISRIDYNPSVIRSYHVLAHKSFQLAPKPFLISRIDYNPSVIRISPQNSTCPSGKLRTKIASPIAKSTSPWLSDSTFFAG